MGKIKIGNCVLENGIFSAPLAGVSDRAFRHICREAGAEYTVSEMISAKALCYEQKTSKKKPDSLRTAPLATVKQDELPMAVQLFGSEPEFMAEAARMIESNLYNGCRSDTPPTAIDINMGCPVQKVVSNKEGSALMKDPKLAADIVRTVCKATSLPVTVKIRSGWDTNSINAPEMAKMLEDAGAALITVHGRTRAQMYSGTSDNGVIAGVKKAVKIPVVGNGDIYSADDALRMLEETGCDGVMVARGSLGNPWIFTEIAARLKGLPYTPPTAEEKIRVAISHLQLMVSEKGEKIAVPEARKHLSWYTKGMVGASAARNEINRATTLDQMKSILKSVIMAEANAR